MKSIIINEKNAYTKTYNSPYTIAVETREFFDSIVPKDMNPVSLRWHDPIRGIYIFEYPPDVKMIYKESHKQGFEIPFPWQIYICHPGKKDVRFFARTEQLKSMDDMLYHQFMPNIYRSGMPCSGAKTIGTTADSTPIEICRAMINGIWMSTFNGGCYISQSGFRSKEISRKNAIHDEKRSLQPIEIQKSGFNEDFWSAKHIHKWLEKRSIEEVLGWEWQEADTVKNVVEWFAQTLHEKETGLESLLSNMNKMPSAKATQLSDIE